MTNTTLLEEKISESGLKKQYVASYLGITRQTLMSKVKNDIPFNQYEIGKLCVLLKITDLQEKENIFFANIVD